MRVDIELSGADLSGLVTRVENGERPEIYRAGVPVARLVPAERLNPGVAFLAARGNLAGQIVISDDFELTDGEIDALFYAN